MVYVGLSDSDTQAAVGLLVCYFDSCPHCAGTLAYAIMPDCTLLSAQAEIVL